MCPLSNHDLNIGVSLYFPQLCLILKDTLAIKKLALSIQTFLQYWAVIMEEGSSDQFPLRFSKQQWNKLVDILNAVIWVYYRKHLKQLHQNSRHNNKSRPETTFILVIKEIKTEKVGFFDSEYRNSSPIVNVGKNVFYQDIYAFVDHLKNME